MSIRVVVNSGPGFTAEEYQPGVNNVKEVHLEPDGCLTITMEDGSNITYYRYPVKVVQTPDPAPAAPVTP